MCLTRLPAASNCHIYPATLYQNEAMNRCKKSSRTCTLQFFTFFPAIYSIYNDSARKNRAGFSHVHVCGLGQTNFPPVIYAYIQSRRVWRGSGQAWRLESAMGISCLGWTQTWLKSAQAALHRYDTICAHNLFTVYHIDKLPNRQPHII